MRELFEWKNYVKYQESDGDGCVFISYQSKSFQEVLKISNFLEVNQIKTWYAPRNIELGEEWPLKLEEAISKCKAILLLYTKDADRSKHVLREISLADEKDKAIVWLKLDETAPSKSLKYYLSLIQTISYQNEEEVLKKLVNIFSPPIMSKEYLSSVKGVDSIEAADSGEVQEWAKGIYAFRSPSEAGECVARIYFSSARNHSESTVLLPTGRSAKEIFYGMIRISNGYEDCPFGSAYIMNDTETYGVNPRHSTSRIKTINDFLIEPLRCMGKGPSEDRLTYYTGISYGEDEPEEDARKQLLEHPVVVSGVSVSPYGEIIGYDFGVHSDDIINDGPRTIVVNDDSKNYIDMKQKSNTIYSVGLKTLLDSDILLILAFDQNKAKAIRTLFRGEITPDMPITLLKNHKNAYVIITRDVAEKAGILSQCVEDISPKEVAECVIKQSF